MEIEELTARRRATLEPKKDESDLSMVEPHRKVQEDED